MFWENRFLASCETLRSRVFSCVLVFISVSIVHFKKQGERENKIVNWKRSQTCRKNWCRFSAWSGWWTVLIQGSSLFLNWGAAIAGLPSERHGCADLQTTSVILSIPSCALLGGVCTLLLLSEEKTRFSSVWFPSDAVSFHLFISSQVAPFRRTNLEDIENYHRVSYHSIHIHGEFNIPSIIFHWLDCVR